MDTPLERKFLHDIANPMSICRLTVGLMLEEIKAEPPSPFRDNLEKRVARVLRALDKLEELHAAHKAEITALEKKAA